MEEAAKPITRLLILISSESDVRGEGPIRINDDLASCPEIAGDWPETRLPSDGPPVRGERNGTSRFDLIRFVKAILDGRQTGLMLRLEP
jgi:hypothetical protein